MGLKEQANIDIQLITSDKDGFGDDIKMIAPNGSEATIVGLHTKQHLGIDSDGNMINTKNAHISVSEAFLVQQNYPVRNNAGEVDLDFHKAIVKDSTGVSKTYVIREWFPDETVGLITCILGDFE